MVSIIEANGAQLEVVDWGGTGTPIILLAGLGNTAHIFDDFAPSLTDIGHVIGITRRGFGASSTPDSGYDTATLGLDVLAVVDALKLDRPILVGHSLGGEELTWIAANRADRIRGIAYLDAAFDRVELFAAFGMTPRMTLPPPPAPPESAQGSAAALAQHMSETQGMPIPIGEVRARVELDANGRYVKSTERGHVTGLIVEGVIHPEYAKISVPALAMFVVYADPTLPIAQLAAVERERFVREAPSAKVVEIRGTHHYHFLTNRDETLRELRPFFASLAS